MRELILGTFGLIGMGLIGLILASAPWMAEDFYVFLR